MHIAVPKGAPNGLGSDEPFLRLSPSELRRLALTYGTPLFILDRAYLQRRMQSFIGTWKRVFPQGQAYYSYKTNYLPDVCRAAHASGMGADAVSGYELEHARRMCPQLPIVFNGPMKTRAELKLALDINARINIDCEEEIDRLSELCAGQRPDYEVGLRVNPGCAIFGSKDRSFVSAHRSAMQRTKFGWPIEFRPCSQDRREDCFPGIPADRDTLPSRIANYRAKTAFRCDRARTGFCRGPSPGWLDNTGSKHRWRVRRAGNGSAASRLVVGDQAGDGGTP